MSSLSKIVLTGKVVRTPEKRFTGNNLPITTFGIDIGADDDEKILRVIAVGKLGETVAESVQKGQNVIVEGRLQTATVKTESGIEKKINEISAHGVEIISASIQHDISSSRVDEYEFAEEISDEELNGVDEIPF